MNDDSRQRRIDELFLAACEMETDQAGPFLADQCGGDVDLRREVERLLTAQQQNVQFLDHPPIPGAAEEVRQAADDVLRDATENRAARADRNLLYGIIALQMNFVGRDQLIKAMHDWVISKSTPIGQLLHNDGALGAESMNLLTALVDKHLEFHGGNAEVSLQTLSTIGRDLASQLAGIADEDLERSLSLVPTGRVGNDDRAPVPVSQSSSAGDRFQVLRFHNRGGMAKVSLARDRELNREVAFKEIREEFRDIREYQERMRVEAEITGGLEHPGIVPVYGLGADQDGHPFYAMRFIRGDNLKSAIAEYRSARTGMSSSQQNLELRRLLRRFVDVCEAVQYAHSRGVLHRDLKPGNIMLGRYGETLVVDWGLAKAVGHRFPSIPEETQPLSPQSGDTAAPTRGTIGTLNYMSPEQATRGELGPATDVFSLGATLYCLLSGRPPYVETELAGGEARDRKLLEMARDCDFPPPREVDDSVPVGLQAICLKAMRQNPGQRYPTPQALADDVECWLADEPITARRDPWIDRFARMVRRHRAAVAGILAVLVTAVVALLAISTIVHNNYLREQALNVELTQANRRAEADFATARHVSFDLVRQAEDTLAQMPGLEAYRRLVTNMALDGYRSFFDRRKNLDSELQRDMAILYRYAANLDRLYSDYDRATEKYQESVGILRQLNEGRPGDPATRDLLAATLCDYGAMLLTRGKMTDAEQAIEEAQQIAGRLREEFPDSMACRRTDAIGQTVAADLRLEYLDHEAALSNLQNAGQVFRELMVSDRHVPTDTTLLVLALTGQSGILREQDLAADARPLADDALQMADGPLRGNSDRHARHAVAHANLEMAKVLGQLDIDDKLQARYLKTAIQTWEQLAREYPMTAFYREYLAISLASLAVAQSRAGAREEAGDQIAQAVEIMNRLIREGPRTPGIHESAAEILVQAARVDSRQNPTRLKQAARQLESAIEMCRDSKRLQKMLETIKTNTPSSSQE